VYPLSVGLIIGTKAIWDELQATVADLPVRVVLEQNDIPDWAPFLEKVERLRPDLLLVDITALHASLEDLVQRVRATSAAPAIFVLQESMDPELILKALRLGVSEYLHPPFADPLRAALERVSAERRRGDGSTKPGGRVLGMLSAKGGCGATTIACHTATALAARTARKVLLADFDLEAGLIGFLMKAKSPYTVMDALRNVHRLDGNYWNALISNGIPNVEILTSPAPPADHVVTADQIRYVGRFARMQYDWIITDLGRGLTPFSLRVIEEVDELFLVTMLEVPALHQAKQLIQRLTDSGYRSHRIRLLLNRTPKRSDITLDEVQTMLGISVYATIGDDPASLQECYTDGKLAPIGSPIGRHCEDLAIKIAGIEPKQKKKFSFF
jgi:pilus assembly protein CpaE